MTDTPEHAPTKVPTYGASASPGTNPTHPTPGDALSQVHELQRKIDDSRRQLEIEAYRALGMLMTFNRFDIIPRGHRNDAKEICSASDDLLLRIDEMELEMRRIGQECKT